MLLAIALAGPATGGGASAAELESDGGDVAVDIHAFVSQGALLSTANNYLARSKRGSLEFSELGVNFQSQLTDRLRVGLQLFSRDLGPVGNYQMKADWFYLDYRWRDWFGFRAGRIKLPFGLYNDTSDIDAARVFVLLPQSFYPSTNRDYLLAQTGMEVYGYVDLQAAGALEYRLYFGTIFIDVSTSPVIKSLDSPYIAGGRLLWDTPVQGLRLGASAQALRLTFGYLLDPTKPPTNVGFDVVQGAASAELTRRDLAIAAELSEWRVVVDEDSLPFLRPLAPDLKHVTVSARGYLSATYHVARWLWPGAYYSFLFPDERDATFTGASKNMQHDVAGALRFDVNAHWLVKLEAHYMHGTAGLDPTLNGVMSVDTLTRDWALFLVKTTAYF